MKQVSVVIPSYNQEQFVTAAVESVLAQTYQNFEIVVVDDGSTDDTQTRLRPYAGQIRLVCQPNQGLSGARNAGFRVSSGDYIWFLDSDDLLHPTALEQQVNHLNQHPDCGLVYCAWQQVSSDGSLVLGEVHPRKGGHLLKEILLRTLFFFPSAALLRRSALERVGLFDETLAWGDDADLWLRLAAAGYAFGYTDQPLLRYRVHTGSMTSDVTLRQIKGWQDSLRKFFSNSHLPADIRALEKQAYSVLHFETAGRYYRSGRLNAAQQQIILGLEANPSFDLNWFLDWAAGTALDPRTSAPAAFIDQVFNNLPPQAHFLSSLRRRAHGRYHTAALFAAYARTDLAAVRAHIRKAVIHDPRVLGNRGLLRIALTAFLGYKKP